MRSGDIAVVDDAGYLHIVDRVKDIVIRGGYNIAPSEIEAVLHRHPAVVEVAVIGVPDEQWGEALHAVVALRADAELAAEVAEERLRDWCRDEGLPSLKVPGTVSLVDALPKNAVGKVDKGALRAERWTGERQV